MPAEVEWFANLDNPRTRRAYQNELENFCSFVGLTTADEFLAVTRTHVLAWRTQLEQRGLVGATIRRKLAAPASLFNHLLESNAVAGSNPVHGVKRPKIDTNKGKTPAVGDHQAKALLEAPDPATLKGQRDRAILSVLLYHGLRRELNTCRSMVRAASCVLCRSIRSRPSGSIPIWNNQGISWTTLKPCSLCRCVANKPEPESVPTASMRWWAVML